MCPCIHAYVCHSGGESKGTIDHILHSKGIVPVASVPLPTEADIGADALPTPEDPSDHLPICVTYVFA